MPQETGKNAEQIKQKIDFYKENLKFLNSFYLPLITGIITLTFSNNLILLKAIWILVSLIAWEYLTLLKLEVLTKINSLIKKL